MVSVTLDGVTKRFGDVVALNKVSFTAEHGNLVVLLGPSGCGKTTTLRIIAGFINPDSGDVLFDGVSVLDKPPKDRNIGFVFQTIALFPHMTAFENIAFGLETRNWEKQRIKTRVLELAKLFHIDTLLDRYPRELSVGQQQRVAIARALAPNPNVLLLDEPLSALDVNLRDELKLEIKKVQEKLKTTMIYVTHDLTEAFSIGNKIVILKDGEVQQIGSPLEIYYSPKNRFVVDFLQVTNMFTGEIKEFSDKYAVIDVNGSTFRILLRKPMQIGKKITFIVRPEDLILNPSHANQLFDNIFEMVVENVDFKGPFMEVLGRFEDMRIRILTTSKNYLPKLKSGMKINVGFSSSTVSILQNS